MIPQDGSVKYDDRARIIVLSKMGSCVECVATHISSNIGQRIHLQTVCLPVFLSLISGNFRFSQIHLNKK